MTLGHVGTNVSDLDRSRAYYDEFMPLVGYRPFIVTPEQFSYEPADGPGVRLFYYRASEPGEHSRHRPGVQRANHDWLYRFQRVRSA